MADGTEDVKVEFGASASDLLNQMKEIVGKAGELTQAFKYVGEAFAAFTATLAGGEAFKEAIGHFEELVDSTRRFMYQTGLAADDAQALAQALKQSDTSADAYGQTLLRMELRLQSNAEMFDAYGVKTRDAKNNLLDADVIFRNVITTLEGMRAGSDRNTVALQLLGRNARDIEPFMRAMKVDLGEIADLQERLGLVLTQTSIDLKDRYSDAVERVQLVMTGVEKVIAEAVMPRLIELGEKFVSLGPDIVDGAGAAITTFLEILDDLKDALVELHEALEDFGKVLVNIFSAGSAEMTGLQFFKNVLAIIGFVATTVIQSMVFWFAALKTGILEIINVVQTLSAVLNAFLYAPWDQKVALMTSAWKEGVKRSVEIARKGAEEMGKAAGKIDASFAKNIAGEKDENSSWGSEGRRRPATPISGTGHAKTFKQGNLAGAQAALLKAQNEAALALEKEYDKEELAATEDLYKSKFTTIDQYYAKKNEIELRQNQQEIDSLQKTYNDIEAQKAKAAGQKNAQEQILHLETEQAKVAGQINVLKAQRTEIVRANTRAQFDANQAEQDALNTIKAKASESKDTDQLNAQKAFLQQRVALLQVSIQDELSEETRLENERYEIKKRALDAQEALVHNDDKLAAQLRADREAAEREHQQNLTDIEYKAEQDRQKLLTGFQTGFGGAFTSLLTTLMQRTKSLGDAFRAFGLQVASVFEDLIAKRFVERLFGSGTAGGSLIDSLMKPIFSAIDLMITKFIEGIGLTTAASKTAGVAEVTTNASIAATAAMASVAAIPLYGWALAPEVGASTYGLALGYLPTAEKGYWKIPTDTLAQVHKEEMVIPREEAQGLRNMIAGGGGGGGDIHLHALDAKSFETFLKGPQGDTLVKHLKRANRDFKLRGATA